ncbi:MAG TPA: hypothetical protein DHN33_08095, partial [Eubacteriaceae bacterium]|nr:hypothetical protein [Eubacteriaceae bacterium]
MKNQIRLILFAVFGLVALGLSYWIAGWIADYAFAYADFFEEMESVLFELAAIKFFILVLFTFLSLYRYMPIIMTGALLIANILSYLYIYLIRFPIQEERMLLIVAAVDLVLVHGIGLLLNLLAPNENPKKKVEKEKSEEQLKLMELQEKIALKRKMMEELERK